MSRKLYLSVGLIGIAAIGFLLTYLVSNSSSTPEESFTQTSPAPDMTSTDANIQLTVAFEDTAVAKFTENPEFVSSMTPFYAQIIYNDVLRNLTEIPFPGRPCYLDPTDAPDNPATPVGKCGPSIVTILFGDEATELTELMNSSGIEGTLGIESYGVQQTSDESLPPFVAVRSRTGFAIPMDTVSSETLLNDTLNRLSDFIVQNWESLESVSTNADIYIELIGNDGSKTLLTTYAALKAAKESGLEGEQLLQALGGWQELTKPVFERRPTR